MIKSEDQLNEIDWIEGNLTFAKDVSRVYWVAPRSPDEKGHTPVRSRNPLPIVWAPHSATISLLLNPSRKNTFRIWNSGVWEPSGYGKKLHGNFLDCDKQKAKLDFSFGKKFFGMSILPYFREICGPPHKVTAFAPAICIRSAQDIEGYLILMGNNKDNAFSRPLFTVCWFSLSRRILPLQPPHCGQLDMFLS